MNVRVSGYGNRDGHADLVPGLEIAMGMPTLFLACCVAVGFVTATSLLLVNNVGKSLYVPQGNCYKYRGDDVERYRKSIQNYPTDIFVLCSSMALCFLLISYPYLLDIENPAVTTDLQQAKRVQGGMVVYSAAYIIYVLLKMRRFCVILLNIMSRDATTRLTPDDADHADSNFSGRESGAPTGVDMPS